MSTMKEQTTKVMGRNEEEASYSICMIFNGSRQRRFKLANLRIERSWSFVQTTIETKKKLIIKFHSQNEKD